VNPEADLQTTHDMTPRVSVIVPVFNTAPYLARCLQSLRESTLREIEIICVDDASTDESAAIVADFVRQDSRIRLIRHDRNMGLGGARNTGIAAARAEYVGGLDSDDWVGPTMFEHLLEATDGGRADVVEGGLIQIDSSGGVIWSYKPVPRVVDNDQNQINIFEATRQAFYTKLWRRSLFVDNDIWFPERLYFEDLATTPRLLTKAKRIHFIEDASYFYMKRDGSITFSASDKHQMDYFRVFDILLDFLLTNDLMDRYKNEFVNLIGGHLAYHASNVPKFDLPEKEKAQYLRYLLMMGSAYRESHVELHGVSSEDLAGRFKEGSAFERAEEIARLRRDIAAIESKASALEQKVASRDKTLQAERKRHLDPVSDPVWKLTAPLRQLISSARRENRKLMRGARQ
jgi:glycosyltransferase involved in cell wall biosynthesis